MNKKTSQRTSPVSKFSDGPVSLRRMKLLRLLSDEWIGIVSLANQLQCSREDLYRVISSCAGQGYSIDKMGVTSLEGRQLYYRVGEKTKQRIVREFGAILWKHEVAPIHGDIGLG